MFKKMSIWNRFVLGFAVVSVGVMALFFNVFEPWDAMGPERLFHGDFESPSAAPSLSGWNGMARLDPKGGIDGSSGAVLTTSPEQHGQLQFIVKNTGGIPAFRVSLSATARNGVKGRKPYFFPRALFFYRDASGRGLFDCKHTLAQLTEDTGWKNYTALFPAPHGARDAVLFIENHGDAGVMQIDDLSVIPVHKHPANLWIKLFFGTLWAAAFGLCLAALRPWKRPWGWAVMITLSILLTGISLPAKTLDDTISRTIQQAEHFWARQPGSVPTTHKEPPPPPPAHPQTRPAAPSIKTPASLPGDEIEQAHQIGHFTLFSLLAFLCALAWLPENPTIKRTAALLTGLLFFAAATEVLQFIAPDRSANLKDLRVDLIGITGAVLFVYLLHRLRGGKKPQQKTNSNRFELCRKKR